MKKDSKKLSVISIILIVLTIFTTAVCYASSGNIMEISSGDNSYIGTLEEYEDLLNTNGAYTQDELKEYYEYYMENYNMHIETEYKRPDFIKAKITNAGIVKEKYGIEEGYQNEQYYTFPIKYNVQILEVEILEGEYQGQKFEFEYYLNADKINNIKYTSLNSGDTVFVILTQDEETGKVSVQLSEYGVNIERFGVFACVALIAIILLIIFGGKKGIITSLIILLITVSCVVIIPNFYDNIVATIISGLILVLFLITLVSFHELGINKKSFKAICLSAILTILTLGLIIVVNYLTRITGVTMDAITFSNYTLATGVNLEIIYNLITLIIASVAITDVVSKTILKIEDEKEKTFSEKLDTCKEIVSSNVIILTVAMLALYIPKHLYLISNKYMGIEICNAESMISEIIRLFIIIIMTSLAMPAIVVNYELKNKLYNKK